MPVPPPPPLPSPAWIEPGAVWPDDRGEHIQAHGGGVLRVGDAFYWFGEYRGRDTQPGLKDVGCYRSTDLVHWTFQRRVVSDLPMPTDLAEAAAALPPRADHRGGGGSRVNWVLERPHVYRNARTGRFVLYAHADDATYRLARVAVFVSDAVDGPYRYVRSFRPLDQESRDIGQFVDDDGAAYLIFEARPTHGFFIAQLSDDYLSVAKQTAFIKAPLEGGALVRHDGLYYAVASWMTGWAANNNQYATAPSLAGPWSAFRDIAPPKEKTYGSQSTCLLKIAGDRQTTVVYMGDAWRPKAQWDSRYLWMPLEIGGGTLRLPAPRPWTIDVQSGVVTFR